MNNMTPSDVYLVVTDIRHLIYWSMGLLIAVFVICVVVSPIVITVILRGRGVYKENIKLLKLMEANARYADRKEENTVRAVEAAKEITARSATAAAVKADMAATKADVAANKADKATKVVETNRDWIRQQLEGISRVIEMVRHATNSLTDQLVKKTEQEALLRGGVEERARAELRASDMPAVVVADVNQKITAFNPSACLLFGYSDPSEIVGQKIPVLIPDRLKNAHTLAMQNVMDVGIDRYPEKTLHTHARRKDGTELPVQITVKAEKSGQDWVFLAAIIPEYEVANQSETKKAVDRMEDKIDALPEKTADLTADKIAEKINHQE